MDIKLQRCPFCGTAEPTWCTTEEDGCEIYTVFCTRCDRSISSANSMKEAWDTWDSTSKIMQKHFNHTVDTEPLHGGCMWEVVGK